MFGIIIVTIFIAVYYYNARYFNYWAKKRVKNDEPLIFFGNNFKSFLMNQSKSETLEQIYYRYAYEKVVGFYRSFQPELILRDPTLIKEVMVTDCEHFQRRGFLPSPHAVEPLLRTIGSIEGDSWKILRHVMSSVFTSSKLNAMFPLLIDSAEKLQERVVNTNLDLPIDARDLIGRYAMDIIGRVGLGLDAENINDDDCEFHKLCSFIFNVEPKDTMAHVAKNTFPVLCKNLKYFQEVNDRFSSLVQQVKNSRGYKPSGKNDIVDVLLESKQRAPTENDSIEKDTLEETPDQIKMGIDDSLSDSQIIQLFAAGLEASSNVASYTLHQLAFNPEIQKKVQQEIDQVLAKHNNQLSFESIREMMYLSWTLKESMRIFPAIGYITRECSHKYTFSGIDLTIDEGVRIIIPVHALNMDHQYWWNPREFNPERFHPDNFTLAQKSIYFPFGEGPRNCIGFRLGNMASLAGLAAILSRFTVEPVPYSDRFPEVDPASDMVQQPKGGKLPLMFRRRDTLTECVTAKSATI